MKYLLTTTIVWAGLAMPVSASLLNSWENSLDNWVTVGAGTSISSTATAPAAAITEGDYALELVHTNGGGYESVARLESPNYYPALSTNNRIEVDIFVPSAAIADISWGKVGLRLEGTVDATVAHDFTYAERKQGQDVVVSLSYDYTANPAVNWGQVTLFIQGPGSATVPMSPFYADNFRIYTIPEPSTLAMLAAGSLLCGVVCRRRRPKESLTF